MFIHRPAILVQALLAGIAFTNPVPDYPSSSAATWRSSQPTSSWSSSSRTGSWSSTWTGSSPTGSPTSKTYPCQGRDSGGSYIDYWNITISNDTANSPLTDMTANKARAALTPVLIGNQDAYLPAINFASAAYYDNATVSSWSCPINCKTGPTPNFTDITYGGNDPQGLSGLFVGEPTYYVGYNPGAQNITLAGVNGGQGVVVVAFRGTDKNGKNIAANGFSSLEKPDTKNFPGAAAAGALVHSGYVENWLQEVEEIVTLVQNKLTKHAAKAVLVSGHSQGAADAVFQAVALKNRLPAGTLVSLIGLAMPRTGNTAWADYVDSRNLAVVAHIGNGRDPIPVTPPQSFGYRQISGELHIDADTTANVRRNWYFCPGRDNTDPKCIAGVHADTIAIEALIEPNFRFHNGPYDGICMGQPCAN